MATRSSGKSSTKRKTKSADLEHASGVVKAMSKKKIKTVNGMKPVFSFCIEDDEGDDIWYRTGFTQPEFEKGDEIEFDFEETKYGLEVAMDSVEVVEEGDDDDEEDEEEDERPARKSKAKSKSRNKRGQRESGKEKQGPGTKEGYWDEKSRRDVETDLKISYAAARNAAIPLVGQMIAGGVLVLPKEGTGKATISKRVSAYEAYLDHYTNQFFAKVCDVEGLRVILADTATVGGESEDEEGDED